MMEYNFTTYISDTDSLAFDRCRGILIVQTPNPLTSHTVAGRFRTTIVRTIRNLSLALDGVAVQDVQFQSRR